MREEQQGLRIIEGLRGRQPKRAHAAPVSSPADDRFLRDAQNYRPPRNGSGALAVALEATERRLSSLLQDRDRIGRDLHDCILQSVYAIGLNIEAARRLSGTDRSPFRGYADQAVVQVNRLIREIRNLIFGLQSETVTGLELDRELQEVIESYRTLCRPRFELDLDPAALSLLTSEESRHLVSIAREALNNSVRHANAAHIRVSLRRRKHHLQFEVRDDGIGIATTRTMRRGFGLSNIEARAKQLGIRFLIRSSPDQGTSIVLNLPLERLGVSVET
jgi:signal transduction histidine kinase